MNATPEAALAIASKTPRELIVALIDAGWSQGSIAEVIGISQPTISNIYRGKRRRVRLHIETLRQLVSSIDNTVGTP